MSWWQALLQQKLVLVLLNGLVFSVGLVGFGFLIYWLSIAAQRLRRAPNYGGTADIAVSSLTDWLERAAILLCLPATILEPVARCVPRNLRDAAFHISMIVSLLSFSLLAAIAPPALALLLASWALIAVTMVMANWGVARSRIVADSAGWLTRRVKEVGSDAETGDPETGALESQFDKLLMGRLIFLPRPRPSGTNAVIALLFFPALCSVTLSAAHSAGLAMLGSVKSQPIDFVVFVAAELLKASIIVDVGDLVSVDTRDIVDHGIVISSTLDRAIVFALRLFVTIGVLAVAKGLWEGARQRHSGSSLVHLATALRSRKRALIGHALGEISHRARVAGNDDERKFGALLLAIARSYESDRTPKLKISALVRYLAAIELLDGVMGHQDQWKSMSAYTAPELFAPLYRSIVCSLMPLLDETGLKKEKTDLGVRFAIIVDNLHENESLELSRAIGCNPRAVAAAYVSAALMDETLVGSDKLQLIMLKASLDKNPPELWTK